MPQTPNRKQKVEKITAPRGTFDVLFAESEARAKLEAAAGVILQSAGYQRIETPTFEATQLFARGVGAATDIVKKEMYSFEDAGGRSLTLKPEGTAPVARAYVQHGMHKLAQPVKLWYLSSFYRYERAQKGRYRQFSQIGAEALGSEDPALDAESIVLLHQLLREIGAHGLTLRLSSLGSPHARRAYSELLSAHLNAHRDQLSTDVRERIELNPLRAFDSQHPGTVAVMRSAPLLLDQLDRDDQAHFQQVKALLDIAGVPYQVDPTLVRGLDYYTKTVFEFTSPQLGAQSGVGGGGRYDGLVQQLGGPVTPCVGWAAGVERMLLASSTLTAAEGALDLYICLDEEESRRSSGAPSAPPRAAGTPPALPRNKATAFHLLCVAREAGLLAELELAGRSLKGQLSQADKRRARYAAIVGSEAILLKDLRGGTQSELPRGAPPQELLRHIQPVASA